MPSNQAWSIRAGDAGDVQLEVAAEAPQAAFKVFDMDLAQFRRPLGRDHFINDFAHGALFQARRVALLEKIHGFLQCCPFRQALHGRHVFEHGDVQRQAQRPQKVNGLDVE